MRLLFVEDQPESVQPVIDALEKGSEPCSCEVKPFSEAKALIGTESYDIVVLDLFAGAPSEQDAPGREVYQWIWEQHFCPVIIYSAQPDAIEKASEHPFVRCVTKGKGSVDRVQTAIAGFRPHIEAIAETQHYINRELASVLREVAPYAFETFPGEAETAKRSDVIVRAGRRRLAGSMDELSRHGAALEGWEQYLSPPVSKSICLGDVLQEDGKAWTVPESFRVVLTPSCDLDTADGRKAKVENVLVACCCSVKTGIAATSLGDITAKKLKDRLPAMLAHGHFETILLFPELVGRIPHMAANLRKLEHLPLTDIGEGRKFKRVASIDSPFREALAWAYMGTACRPGPPDRDLHKWSDGFLSAYSDETGKKR